MFKSAVLYNPVLSLWQVWVKLTLCCLPMASHYEWGISTRHSLHLLDRYSNNIYTNNTSKFFCLYKNQFLNIA